MTAYRLSLEGSCAVIDRAYNALDFWAQRYPSIKALGQLRAIELRTRLVEDVKAGRQ